MSKVKISFKANTRLHRIAKTHAASKGITMTQVLQDGLDTMWTAKTSRNMIIIVKDMFPAKEGRKSCTMDIDENLNVAAWQLGLNNDFNIRDVYSAALYWGTKGAQDGTAIPR